MRRERDDARPPRSDPRDARPVPPAPGVVRSVPAKPDSAHPVPSPAARPYVPPAYPTAVPADDRLGPFASAALPAQRRPAVPPVQLAQELGRGSTVATVAVDTGFKYLAGDLYRE